MEKYTLSEASKIFEGRGLRLLPNQTYEGVFAKLHAQDSEGYKYSISFDALKTNIRTGKTSCYKFSTRNIFTVDNILLWISKNNKTYRMISRHFTRSSGRDILMECKLCSRQWVTSWNDLLNSKGCFECSTKRAGLQRRIPLGKVIEEFAKQKLTILDPSSYISTAIKVLVKCNVCDYEFSTDYHSIGNNHGCPKCKSSHGEKAIHQFLIANSINYTAEKSFADCRHKKPLPFDFYLPDYNVCIEFQGILHEKAIPFFGGEKHLADQQMRDKIKKDYCLNKNINFLEISYVDFDKIDSILIQFLNNL